MTDHPIIFSAAMIRALLENRKTMTRRLATREIIKSDVSKTGRSIFGPSLWQRVKPGDRLYVRERHAFSGLYAAYTPADWDEFAKNDYAGNLAHRVRENHMVCEADADGYDLASQHWRPGMFHFRWACRLTLVVTATKVERLQDISEADAIAEGVRHRWLRSHNCAPRSHYFVPIDNVEKEHSAGTAKGAFEMLWRSLHGFQSWDENPEVVAPTFTVHKTNIDSMAEAAWST